MQRLRRALLRESGGDRLMARVLALVPTAGLVMVLTLLLLFVLPLTLAISTVASNAEEVVAWVK